MEKYLNEILVKGYKEAYQVRTDNNIHISNLIDFCSREFALCIKHKKYYNHTEKKLIPIGTILTYSIGDAIHNSVKGAIKHLGLLAGEEIKVGSDKYGFPIRGSLDMLVRHPQINFITEIKSISSESFDELTEPLVNHVCQLSLYLHFIEERTDIKDLVDLQKGVLLYVSKQQKKMPFKSFLVEKNNEFVKTVLVRLKEVKTFSETKKLPVRMCNSPLTYMARRPCKMVSACFNGKF